MSDTPRRRWHRFSLRTLLIFGLLLGSAAALWQIWEPWAVTLEFPVRLGKNESVVYSDQELYSGAPGDLDSFKHWNSENGSLLPLKSVPRQLRILILKPDTRPTSSQRLKLITQQDHSIWLKNVGTNELVPLQGATVPSADRQTASFFFSDDRHSILTVNTDGKVRLYDALDGEQRITLSDSHGSILTADISGDNQHIVTTSAEGRVLVWTRRHAENAECLLRLWQYQTTLLLLLFLMISIGFDRRRATAPAPVNALASAPVETQAETLVKFPRIAFSLRTLLLLTIGAGSAAWLHHDWNPWLKQWEVAVDPQDVLLPVQIVDGYWRTITVDNFDVLIRNAQSGAEVCTLRGHTQRPLFAAYSPDARRIATTALDGTVRIWDAHTARMLALIERDVYRAAIFSPDGRRLLTTARFNNSSTVWNVEDGSEVAVLKHFTLRIPQQRGGREDYSNPAICWRPDGRRILAAGSDGTVREWDAETGAVVNSRNGSVAAAYSPDGANIAVGTLDHSIEIVDASDFHLVHTMGVLSKPINFLNYSPDGAFIAAFGDGDSQVWDVKSGGRMPLPLGGVPRSIHGTSPFSPNPPRIVTLTARELQVCDIRSGAVLARLETGRTEGGGFSADGEHLIARNARSTSVWVRHHPEYYSGLMWLPAFWACVLTVVLLAWNIVANRRRKRAGTPA